MGSVPWRRHSGSWTNALADGRCVREDAIDFEAAGIKWTWRGAPAQTELTQTSAHTSDVCFFYVIDTHIRETSDMTSDVAGSHLPESLYGPCGCQRYREINTPKSKVQSPHSPVRDEQTHPHRPRLVVSHNTCPPLSSSPHAHSFVIGPAVIKHTHRHLFNTHNLQISARWAD